MSFFFGPIGQFSDLIRIDGTMVLIPFALSLSHSTIQVYYFTFIHEHLPLPLHVFHTIFAVGCWLRPRPALVSQHGNGPTDRLLAHCVTESLIQQLDNVEDR